MFNWISVKDKLPIDGHCQPILIWVESDDNWVNGIWENVMYDGKNFVSEDAYSDCIFKDVTHWVYLIDIKGPFASTEREMREDQYVSQSK